MPSDTHPSSTVRRWRHPLGGSLGVLVAYYAVPINERGGDLVVGLLVTTVATVLVAWAIVGQYRRQLRGEEVASVQSLALLAVLAVSLFSLGFLLVQEASPDQFVGLVTRTDALYFSLSSISTVGYGDVHAAGQTARALVSVQLVFNLIFLAALGSIFTGRLRERAASAQNGRGQGSSETGTEGDPKTNPKA